MKRAILFLGLALSGCGASTDLKPAPGTSLPVAPLGATATPTATQLMTATTQQRPARSDELLSSSDERRNDAFDLPPAK